MQKKKLSTKSYPYSKKTDRTGSLLSRRERLSADCRKAAALQKARRRIARKIDYNSAFSITKLRLGTGFSQAELAQLTGTPQATLAQLGKGQCKPQLALMENLATALGVPSERMHAAFASTKAALVRK